MIFYNKDVDMSIISNPDDPLLVKTYVNNKEVYGLLVDISSSAYIMFYDFFRNLRIPQLKWLPYNEDLIVFSGHHISLIGYMKLHVTFGKAPVTRTIIAKFIVVKLQSSYNAILGRPTLNTLREVISMVHLAMKFLSDEMQVITLKRDQKKAHVCYKESLKRKKFDMLDEMDYEPKAKTQSKVMLINLDCIEDVKRGMGHLGRSQEGALRTSKSERQNNK